jgi:Ca2+-binding EF-hand superfamily protein
LARYRAPDLLKKEIFNILMNSVESDLIQKWNEHFEKLDTDHTGMIKIKELIRLIAKTGQFKSQLRKLKDLNKKDSNLKIQYSDFLLRIVEIKKEIKCKDILTAFNHLDTDMETLAPTGFENKNPRLSLKPDILSLVENNG